MTKDIIKELVLMLGNDQEDLKRFRTGTSTLEQMRTSVKGRTVRLKEILTDTFPNIENAGVQAYTAALVMALHSGDRDLMMSYLNEHEQQPKNAVNQSDRAVLIDKILILEGKSQRYGTQFVMKKERLEIHPLEDAEQVNERRASLGLNSLEDYVQGISNTITLL